MVCILLKINIYILKRIVLLELNVSVNHIYGMMKMIHDEYKNIDDFASAYDETEHIEWCNPVKLMKLIDIKYVEIS